MIGWVFAGITLSAVVMATFIVHTRRAILALWVAGLGVGAIYLTIGAEFLAIIQWIVSTLSTISFIFFAVMFGEYSAPESKSVRRGVVFILLSICLGLCFAAIVVLGASELPAVQLVADMAGNDLEVIGKLLAQDNLLSLEVLSLTLFLVLVGGGVIARSERGDMS